jgi:hypothetical protein
VFNIRNVHQRTWTISSDVLADLVASLATDNDRLWPIQRWPAMRFESPGLAEGARGGHGPIRYTVEEYLPGQRVRFRFSGPEGFNGWHGYEIEPGADGQVTLRHVLAMRPGGLAMLSWPLVFRPLHNALIEDSLDRAAAAIAGERYRPREFGAYVRFLRRLFRRRAG